MCHCQWGCVGMISTAIPTRGGDMDTWAQPHLEDGCGVMGSCLAQSRSAWVAKGEWLARVMSPAVFNVHGNWGIGACNTYSLSV